MCARRLSIAVSAHKGGGGGGHDNITAANVRFVAH